MIGRVTTPGETTYLADYTRKRSKKEIARNMSTAVTTGDHYTKTPSSLYRSEQSDLADQTTYVRHGSFKTELYKLPPGYESTAKPDLDPPAPDTDFHHNFGRTGERATIKRAVAVTPRELSKRTTADITGTTRITHYPPGYTGHIPREWKGNRGKSTFEERSASDITWQYHPATVGYGGYVPVNEIDVQTRSGMHRTETTYRAMCDEIGFRL